MKANSRYCVVNPDHDKIQVPPVTKRMKNSTVQEYTDGFYTSSTDNENDEIKMMQEQYQTRGKELGNIKMIDDKSDSSLGIDFGSSRN